MSALLCFLVFFFFFKQKTAYEMRISDWSSDVCSSDLHDRQRVVDLGERAEVVVERRHASPHVRGDASHRQRLVTVPVHQCERGFDHLFTAEDRYATAQGACRLVFFSLRSLDFLHDRYSRWIPEIGRASYRERVSQ